MGLDDDVLLTAFDNLDALDALLLQFEREICAGSTSVALVHVMFRHAHNVKGALGMLNRVECQHLMHSVESVLDKMRNHQLPPTQTIAELSLNGASLVRSHLDGCENEAEMAALAEELLALTVGGGSSTQMSAVADLPARMQAILVNLGAGRRVFRVEKLVSAQLTAEQVQSLPIMSDILGVGALVDVILPSDELRQSSEEMLLQIVFTSDNSRSELESSIFDPFVELERDTSSQPAD